MAASPAPAPTGWKRSFLLFGGVNVAVTNTALQFLLRVVPIGLATSLRQLINGALGYVFLARGGSGSIDWSSGPPRPMPWFRLFR